LSFCAKRRIDSASREMKEIPNNPATAGRNDLLEKGLIGTHLQKSLNIK